MSAFAPTRDVASIPSHIVEPLIAASVLYVGIENFFVRRINRRWRITGLFGLVHGFGFAGALCAFGIPSDAMAPALGAFNLGVEIGQLGMVLIVVPLLLLVDRMAAAAASPPIAPRRSIV
jgi:hypothetical protein